MTANKSYSEKLRDPRWQRKRLEILNRSNFKCQSCNDKDSPLHVHHCWYERNADPWSYPDDAYLCLCETCHALREDEEYRVKVALSAYSICGLSDISFILDSLTAIGDQLALRLHFREFLKERGVEL